MKAKTLTTEPKINRMNVNGAYFHEKILSMTMTLIMLMALAVPAFAVNKESDSNSEAEAQEEILESASEFAYLDADKATPELKEKILEARKEIIYNTDWVADGYVGCIRNIKTGKLIKELPEFSEVFPGWDVPIEENNAKIEISEPVLPAVPADNTMEEIKPLSIGTGLDDWIVLLSERVYLKSASSTTNATPFAAFTLDPYKMGTQIRAYATSLSASETCNIGFSDYSSGKSLASAVNLVEYEALELYVGVGKPTVGVRASTYSNPGWSTIKVDGAYRITNIR